MSKSFDDKVDTQEMFLKVLTWYDYYSRIENPLEASIEDISILTDAMAEFANSATPDDIIALSSWTMLLFDTLRKHTSLTFEEVQNEILSPASLHVICNSV